MYRKYRVSLAVSTKFAGGDLYHGMVGMYTYVHIHIQEVLDKAREHEFAKFFMVWCVCAHVHTHVQEELDKAGKHKFAKAHVLIHIHMYTYIYR
jgi:hypothetical protein